MRGKFAGKLLLTAALVTGLASTGFAPVAFADDVRLVSQNVAASELKDDVDWTGVAAAFQGLTDPSVVQNGPMFALAKIAKLRGVTFSSLLGQLKDSGSVEPMSADWLKRVALYAGYSVDSTPEVGSIAYFSKGATVTRTGLGETAPLTYRNGHLAYVAGVNSDGSVTIEEYGYGYREGYKTYSIPASSVGEFIHVPIVKEWISGAFEPSSPGVPRDLPNDPAFGNNYPVRAVALDGGVDPDDDAAVKAGILQCGTFAEWWVANQLGTTNTGLAERTVSRGETRGVTPAPSTSAGQMDEHYRDLGVRVDRTPAVGSVATWEAAKLGAPGHAAVVTRVYRLLKSDKEKADRLGNDTYPDTVTLKKLIDRARDSKEPKLTYVLLEDYNGYGTANKYGQKLLPADNAHHYIHLAANQDAKTPYTAVDEIAAMVKSNPDWQLRLGTPTAQVDVDAAMTVQHYEHGSVAYDSETKQFGINAPELTAAQQQSLADNPATPAPVRTDDERLKAQIKQMKDALRTVSAKYVTSKPAGPIAAALASLTDKITQLQAKVAAAAQED